MSHSVFICFHRQDAAAAKRIATALRAAGLSITAINPQITDPETLRQELVKKIEGADGVVALVSADSVASKRFRAEIGFAAKRKKLIVPALVAEADIPPPFGRDYHDLVSASDADLADFAAEVASQLTATGVEDYAELDELAESADERLRDESRVRAEAPRRKRQGTLWVSPSGGPSNFVFALIASVLILLVAVVVVLYMQQEESVVSVPDNWQHHETNNVRIAAPPNWNRYTEADIMAMGGEFSGGSSVDLEALAGGGVDSVTLELALEDPATGAVVMLVSGHMSEPQSLSQIREEITAGMGEIPPEMADMLKIETVRLPAGESLKVAMRMDFLGMGLEIEMYATIKGDVLYLLMWTAATGEEGPPADTLEAILQSYEIK